MYARAHTHAHTHMSHTHAHARTCTHTRAHTHARTHTQTHSRSVSYSVSYTHTRITPIHPHVLHDLFGAMQIVLASGVQAPHPKCVCVSSKFKMCVCVCARVCVMQIARANGGLRRWNKWWRPSFAKRVTTIWCSGIKVCVCRGDGEGGLNTLYWFSCVIESCLATCVWRYTHAHTHTHNHRYAYDNANRWSQGSDVGEVEQAMQESDS